MVVNNAGSPSKTASLQRLRGPSQPTMDPLKYVATPQTGLDMAEKAKQLVNLTEQQKKIRGFDLENKNKPNPVYEEEWQSDLDTWRRKRKNRLSGADSDVKSPTSPTTPTTISNHLTSDDLIQKTCGDDDHIRSSFVKTEHSSSSSSFDSLKQIHSYTRTKTNMNSMYTDEDSEDYGSDYHKNSKEEILTIRSPNTEENNDSGIENNRNSSSHSPSTSLDFSPRSTDFISPKSLASSTDLPAPPPPPPTQPPTESVGLRSSSAQNIRTLDQVLVPVPTSGSAIRRPSPLEENVDYPPPPHHLLTHNSYNEKKITSTEEELFSPNRARVSATIPSSSYLRQHTKVEPFVAQSIREHQVKSNAIPETNVELSVELNREQKAVVSANKYPTRDTSAYKQTEAAPITSTVNSKYHYGSTGSGLKSSEFSSSNRTHQYQYRDLSSERNPSFHSQLSNQLAHQTANSRLVNHTVSTPNLPTSPAVPSGANMAAIAPPPAPSTIYRTVDIHFDDSAASIYQPPKRDKDGLIAIVIELGAQPVHKGFGFSVSCERRQCFVDSVIVGTPADKQGLQIGDRIESINGESTADKFPSAINRMIHEATRMGEIHLRIERRDGSTISIKLGPLDYESARNQFGGSSRALNSADYRVSSLHEKVGPGRLSDFVPEVERQLDDPRRRAVDSEEAPRTIRNYQVSANEAAYRTRGSSGVYAYDQHTSTLPPAPKAAVEEHISDDDISNSYVKKQPHQVVTPVPPTSILRQKTTTSATSGNRIQASEVSNHYATLENVRYPVQKASSPHHSIPATRNVPIEVLSASATELRYTTPPSDRRIVSEIEDMSSEGDDDDDRLYQRMHQKQPFHTVGSYGVVRSIPIERRPTNISQSAYSGAKQRRRSRSSDDYDISQVSHRFYDRQGNYIQRDQVSDEPRPVRIHREYGEYKYRTEEQRMETRDWRDIINQQRQPAPGQPVDNSKIKEVTASMSALPSIINRKHEEAKKLVKDQNEYHYQPRDYKQTQEIYSIKSDAYNNGYNSLSYQPKNTNSGLREERLAYDEYKTSVMTSQPPAPVPVTPNPVQQSQREAKEYVPGGYKEEQKREPENVVAVSGKHRCAHCATELGRGAAMIVESLNLYYHLACFKCFVCKTPLGSGATGTDVRVREGRLHCQSCYSNDKLQLSKV